MPKKLTAHENNSPNQHPTTMQDYEQSLSKLKSIIEQMERGELRLEQSLQLFEEGVTLIKQCQHTLNAAEQKVQQLIQESGSETLKPYEPKETS